MQLFPPGRSGWVLDITRVMEGGGRAGRERKKRKEKKRKEIGRRRKKG